jgi:asparagine synthase (glutamine-hydrolysing)
MCGIAGIFSTKYSQDQRDAALSRMCSSLFRRGPDDQGQWSNDRISMGMRRLSIFDPANGHQPMQTSDGRFTLVFNGAIYNHRELRKELSEAGQEFTTNCDTEVLLHSFAVWGASCLKRLRGMFAFAVWDDREKELFLARDPFGIKPLYVYEENGSLIFASELKAFSASSLCTMQIDPHAAADYLAWLSVPAPQSIYRNIRSLLPAQYSVWRDGRLSHTAYWTFPSAISGKPATSYVDFQHELRLRLEESIRAHMLADVPVGAFLSGGLDSAVIAGMMSKASGKKLKTFTVCFNETDYSEDKLARESAKFMGSDHTQYLLRGDELARDIDKIIGLLDYPTGDGINTYYASRIAREGGVTAALSGLGGDELFGGYPSFSNVPKILKFLPVWRSFPDKLKAAVLLLLRKGDTRKKKLADMLAHSATLHDLCSQQRKVLSAPEIGTLLSPDFLSEASLHHVDQHPLLGTLCGSIDEKHVFECISAWEICTYMTDVLLRDSDMMSMVHSLELRVPFIDRPFVEWIWTQPSAWKYQRQNPKRCLALACSDLLNPSVMNREKQGFSLPMPQWMKGELKPFLDDTFSGETLSRSGLFNTPSVAQKWKHFLSHNDSREWSRLWSLAILIRFVTR